MCNACCLVNDASMREDTRLAHLLINPYTGSYNIILEQYCNKAARYYEMQKCAVYDYRPGRSSKFTIIDWKADGIVEGDIQIPGSDYC